MKILFASDVSFNYFPEFPGEEQARVVMEDTARVFRQTDFSILNLENILGDPKDYTPIIKSGSNLISDNRFIEYVDTLKPTAIGLANNHAGDYGAEALLHTIEILDQKGYLHTGAGRNLSEAYQPVIFEKEDQHAAIIAICENEFGIATETQAGSAGYSLSRVAKAIQDAKGRDCLPIIYFHGGNEYNPFPSPGKVELYRHFVDLGAKAVIAMHTHCPQGYEFYQNCPIVYSMGNFFFPANRNESLQWTHGYMACLNLKEEGISLEVIPYTFSFDHHTLLKGAEKDAFMKYLAYLCQVISDEKAIQDYFDAWCMIAGAGNYINHVKFSDTMYQNGADEVRHLKNIFSCEAHDELIRNTLKLIYDVRCAEAEKLVPKIKKLQHLEL